MQSRKEEIKTRTDEFVMFANKIEGLKCLKEDSMCNGGAIEIIRNDTVGTGIAIVIPVHAKSMLDLRIDTYRIPDNSKDVLLELINSYLSTPVCERGPEKIYRLSWLNDNDGAKTYLDNEKGVWTCESKRTAREYTESEINELKKANPDYAIIIDMLKEEVKDDE